ncbi:hypothetical protein [Streptomyces yerevanensis]|uniref:hypothetical protein n=1 Tax=Streptomyces yerevanensis TaxID=66378 RepID=UPI00052766DE|nr:hypothetical protein [Streptomyces yerevanensis]
MSSTPQRDAAPPADYQLLLPQGWFRVHIAPERREQSVDALLERQFKGIDNAPQIKMELRKELIRQAARAFDEGGIELYISLQQAGSLTIPASLLVTLVTPRDPKVPLPSLRDLAESLKAEGGKGRTVSVVELAAGSAMKVRVDPESASTRMQPEDGDYALPSVTVDYQLSIPRSDMQLLLTFSTPLVQIADAMVELFDAVAGSLAWKGAAN